MYLQIAQIEILDFQDPKKNPMMQPLCKLQGEA